MSLQTALNQVENILGAISGIGRLHPYERWAADYNRFLDLFKDSQGRVNGWMITRRSTPARPDTRTTIERTHELKLTGIRAVHDEIATEVEFQNLIETICADLSLDMDLDGTTYASDPVSVDIVEYRMFGGTLCHYAELTVPVKEQMTRSL